MRLIARPLFAEDSIEVLLQDALEAIDAAVRRLPFRQLQSPALAQCLASRALPRPPRLGSRIGYRLFETEIVERQSQRGRRWAAAVEVVIPFRGSGAFFGLRAGTIPLHSPSAIVRSRSILMTAADPDCSAAELVERLDARLEVIRRELEEQRRHCDAMRERLEAHASQCIEDRLRHLSTLAAAAEVLDARGWRAVGA